MVKKNKTGDVAPSGWGNSQLGAGTNASGIGPDTDGGANPDYQPPGISTDPENRQPPLDEGWNETVQRELGEEQRPVMGMAPAAEPAPPAEPAKPKKSKKGAAPVDHVPAAASPQRNSDPLIGFVERLERLAEERATITEDMKEVVSEAKSQGYDAAILKKVIGRRRRGREAVQEEEALIETYQNVVGWDV